MNEKNNKHLPFVLHALNQNVDHPESWFQEEGKSPVWRFLHSVRNSGFLFKPLIVLIFDAHKISKRIKTNNNNRMQCYKWKIIDNIIPDHVGSILLFIRFKYIRNWYAQRFFSIHKRIQNEPVEIENTFHTTTERNKMQSHNEHEMLLLLTFKIAFFHTFKSSRKKDNKT